LSHALTIPEQVKRLQAFLGIREDQLKKWACGAVDPASLIRFALLDYSRQDRAGEMLRKCPPETIYTSLIAAAQLGLEPSATRGEGAIVPYKNVAQFQPMYRGLVKLARMNGPVKSVYAHVAYENDRFKVWLGTEARIEHEVAIMSRGNPVAAYAVARLEDDDPMYEILTWDEVLKIKRKAADTPAWRDWETEMGKKSAIKRLCKTLPVGDKFAQAARLDDMVIAGDVDGYKRVIDADVILDEAVEDAPTDDEIPPPPEGAKW
jgi:recombination protein RecT